MSDFLHYCRNVEVGVIAAGDDLLPVSVLLDLGGALGSLDLRASLPRVLEVLAEAFEAPAGMISLLDDTGTLRVEASYGLSPQAAGRARFVAGQGITGRVVQSGKPIVVPRASEEPLFLDRTGTARQARARRKELSFLCVPLIVDGRPVGTLALTVPFRADRPFERDIRMLQVASHMVGQALKVASLVAADRQRLVDENLQLRQELGQRYDLPNVIGTSRPMQEVYERVAQAAPAQTTVLIRGESGTGKELIAHAIHFRSNRSEGPFVKISCGALPEALM